MSDMYVPILISILKKLNENGNKYIAYSPFGKLNIPRIQKKLKISTNSEIEIRSNNELIDQTIQGSKFGLGYSEYPDPDMYGLCRDYYDLQLKIMKLPSELFNDNLIKFNKICDNKPEVLYFNILKLHFNEDGSYEIKL